MPALPPGAFTVLVIDAVGMPLYASRGLSQTLEGVNVGATPRRTVNGTLINLAPPQFQKYHTRISGNDQEPPAIDGVFAGAMITVDCIVEVGIPAGAAPNRPAVAGSIRDDGNFTFYRPQLVMLVTAFSIDTDEWGAMVGWTIDAEEV